MLLVSRVSSRSRRSVRVTRAYNEDIGEWVALAAADAWFFYVTFALFAIRIHPDFLGKDQKTAFQPWLENHMFAGVCPLNIGDWAAFAQGWTPFQACRS